jgi:hypothetical protein
MDLPQDSGNSDSPEPPVNITLHPGAERIEFLRTGAVYWRPYLPGLFITDDEVTMEPYRRTHDPDTSRPDADWLDADWLESDGT